MSDSDHSLLADGLEPDTLDNPHVRFAIDAAELAISQLGGAIQQPQPGHAHLSCPLSNGKNLDCLVLKRAKADTRVVPHGERYIAYVTTTTLQSAFDLCVMAWRLPSLFNMAEKCSRAAQYLDRHLPPGFETMAASRLNSYRTGGRQLPFLDSYVQLIRYHWLHEMAHVCFGHIDRLAGALPLNAPTIDEPDEEVVDQSVPYLALELVADQVALEWLFEDVFIRVFEDTEREHELLTAYIGCLLFPIGRQISDDLVGRFSMARRHPPMWARSRLIEHAVLRSLERVWQRETGAAAELELAKRRDRYITFFRDVVRVFAEIHPSFGHLAHGFSEEAERGFRHLYAEEIEHNVTWLESCNEFVTRPLAPGAL